MRRICLILAAAGALAAVTGCNVHISSLSQSWSDADLKAATNVVQTAALPTGLKSLAVDNQFGNVHIIGTDSGGTAWKWTFNVRAKDDLALQKFVSDAKCTVETNGDRLSLIVSLPETREPHSFQSDLDITAPKSLAVTSQNRFGATEVADFAGDASVTGQNGRVQIRNVSGAVHAQTSFDSLSVNNTGPATLKNQNGRIEATVIGKSLEASTSFDSLTVQDVGGPASLHNQNGRIEAAKIIGALDAETSFDALTARDITGEATLRNQNGRIEASGIGGRLDAKTSFDSLVVRDINGPVHLRNQNGRVEATRTKGNADIATSFDHLRVEGIQGDALLANQNGGVTVTGVTGSVKVTTSFANIEVAGAGARFECHNQNGAIHLRATSATLASIDANTSFDTLEVHLPAALKPAIQAHTTFAEVESDFPVLMKPRGQNAFADAGPDTPRISLQNENGRIGVIRD